ncbi:MAG TPA: galactokinase family protein [Bryobacteraceae bacterium]|nr:galactokinase family protein [Bryobacteraceae bacterium]
MSRDFVSVPGRVNLIGEHIDYHNLPVLPMALDRRVRIEFEPRADRLLRARSGPYPERQFEISAHPDFRPGDWGIYLYAASQIALSRWSLRYGIDARITADLPSAAGLSSSSALLTGIVLALLRANEIEPSIAQMLEVLPDGEQLVGTRGGGMDHAAVVGAKAGCALLVQFAPFKIEPVPIPSGWTFLVAHSLTYAQKSGALKAEYNARRAAGQQALEKIGFSRYQDVLALPDLDTLIRKNEANLTEPELSAFRHVTSEARRLQAALEAIRKNEPGSFGKILVESHESLRDELRVSNPALEELVACALDAGALGARVTGAGFGGCVLVLCRTEESISLQQKLIARFYANRPEFVRQNHLFEAIPSAGALE